MCLGVHLLVHDARIHTPTRLLARCPSSTGSEGRTVCRHQRRRHAAGTQGKPELVYGRGKRVSSGGSVVGPSVLTMQPRGFLAGAASDQHCRVIHKQLLSKNGRRESPLCRQKAEVSGTRLVYRREDRSPGISACQRLPQSVCPHPRQPPPPTPSTRALPRALVGGPTPLLWVALPGRGSPPRTRCRVDGLSTPTSQWRIRFARVTC